MDGSADATAWPLGWSLVRGYFSPATLFLLLNVVIGTIALTSRSSHRRRHHDDDDEHYKAQHQHHHEPQRSHDHQYAPPPPPTPLARTSSVMERLRSLGLYRFRSGDFPPEYNLSAAANAIYDESEKQQAQYNRSRSEPAARLRPVEQKAKEEKKAAPAKAKAVKKPSSEVRKLERAQAQARQVQRAPPPRAPSRTVQGVAREEETAEVALATASSVDARADDFINKFREQLQLQRLNSLLNYKEMLNRGT